MIRKRTKVTITWTRFHENSDNLTFCKPCPLCQNRISIIDGRVLVGDAENVIEVSVVEKEDAECEVTGQGRVIIGTVSVNLNRARVNLML